MISKIARAAANLMMRTFTGQTLEQYEVEQLRGRSLAEVNRLIELRLAQHGYVFRTTVGMGRQLQVALNTTADPKLKAVVMSDPILIDLIRMNSHIGGIDAR